MTSKEEYNFDIQEDSTNGFDTVTVTVTEAHQGLNGVIEPSNDHAPQPAESSNGLVNGAITEQQNMQQLPPLFDMDLERMHAELFKGRYLTPQDFLDDVGKMVHNADVRAHEDLDRLYRAQAMFTAAQVSIQEFDPQLRLECERMAVRERQRREQHKKSKGKEKAHDSQLNGEAPVVARRSARNNGQQPELSITDPVKLERRLKRQRGEECSGGDSHGSEEELNGTTGEGRGAKRTRIIDEDDDHDPLDTIGATPSSVIRSHVHFANDVPAFHPEQMVVDDTSKSSGFDPSLLNPMPPAQPVFHPSPFAPRPDYSSFNFPMMSVDPADPFTTHTGQGQPVPFTQILAKTPTPPPPALTLAPPQPLPSRRTPTPHIRTPEPERVFTPAPVLEPMVVEVERSPSPPLPDFHVDTDLIEDLRQMLCDSTASLTIEQLEQLRATCLGNVWRHRSDWDRDALARELQDVVKDFVEEVSADWSDDEQ